VLVSPCLIPCIPDQSVLFAIPAVNASTPTQRLQVVGASQTLFHHLKTSPLQSRPCDIPVAFSPVSSSRYCCPFQFWPLCYTILPLVSLASPLLRLYLPASCFSPPFALTTSVCTVLRCPAAPLLSSFDADPAPPEHVYINLDVEALASLAWPRFLLSPARSSCFPHAWPLPYRVDHSLTLVLIILRSASHSCARNLISLHPMSASVGVKRSKMALWIMLARGPAPEYVHSFF
jgi:hypothetical protein